MNWLLNLYDQGINGILADEMGLGKTVQALAMLAHIAEHYNIWGPFLVVTPASTLHNWQQEVCESFKGQYISEANFHVLVWTKLFFEFCPSLYNGSLGH